MDEGKVASAGAQYLKNYSSEYPKVLFHCHVFPVDPKSFPPDPATGVSPGTMRHLCALARELGFDSVTAVSPNEVPPGRGTARIDEDKDGPGWLLNEAQGHAEVMLFASLNPEDRRSPDRLIKAHRDGFTGVKFHPFIGRFAVDADRDRAFYEVLDGLRMPLLIHTGIVPHYQPWPIEKHHPFRIDALACKFPGIPIIVAHGGGRPFCREVLAVLQSNENTYLDLTHVLDRKYAWHIPADDLQAFFDQIGPSRIMYGTDYPWYRSDDLTRDLAYLRGLGVDKKAMDLLLGGTFVRVAAQVQGR